MGLKASDWSEMTAGLGRAELPLPPYQLVDNGRCRSLSTKE